MATPERTGCRGARLVALIVIAGITQGAATAGERDGPTLISELPLNGSLVDLATLETAEFLRPSEAYTTSGELVVVNVPRFEAFALSTGFAEYHIDRGADEFTPMAIAWGKLFANDNSNRLWVSEDGVNFEQRGVLPAEIIAQTSALMTPAGNLLLAAR